MGRGKQGLEQMNDPRASWNNLLGQSICEELTVLSIVTIKALVQVPGPNLFLTCPKPHLSCIPVTRHSSRSPLFVRRADSYRGVGWSSKVFVIRPGNCTGSLCNLLFVRSGGVCSSLRRLPFSSRKLLIRPEEFVTRQNSLLHSLGTCHSSERLVIQ